MNRPSKDTSLLSEGFISSANRIIPTNHRASPITPQGPSMLPIDPQQRWETVTTGGAGRSQFLRKVFVFDTYDERNGFLFDLLETELRAQKCASVLTEDLRVTVKLQTKNMQAVSDLDKELAAYLDGLYRDVRFSAGDCIAGIGARPEDHTDGW